MSSRRTKAERTAADAWDYLSSAMAAAGGTARDAGKQGADLAGAKAAELAAKAGRQSSRYADKASRRASKAAGLTSGKVNAAADEAWARANAAANALAGRRPSRPWGLILGVGLLGIAVGWAAAATARAALE